jgi:hypothetical protein
MLHARLKVSDKKAAKKTTVATAIAAISVPKINLTRVDIGDVFVGLLRTTACRRYRATLLPLLPPEQPVVIQPGGLLRRWTHTMHEELWAGVYLKLSHAAFHLIKMEGSLEDSERGRTRMHPALQESAAFHEWQPAFYAYLDAFLSAARSVPEIIQFCFGQDTHPKVKEAFQKLSAEEQARRQRFTERFRRIHADFREHCLSTARDISVHRAGYPDVKVAAISFYGVSYSGNPVEHVPTSETRKMDDRYGFLARPMPVLPRAFTIEGKPLFAACRDYLTHAGCLVKEARTIAEQVHGNNSLTPLMVGT